MRYALPALLVAVQFGALTPPARVAAQPPSLVAPTNALSPEDEQKALVVPDGFEVQLVASEPQIQKPMQMAFDAKGRIWVTTSYHYPFAAPKGQATDKLFILSDFDEKGKARKVQTFAADLNIPIGILPLPDCKSCIVSSVGEILKLTDENDDGKYDKKEVLFGGFGSRDTHGMYNSYTLMPDGWVYACHGFNNDSKTKGKDGRELVMRSGNTFRFKPDGSRVEAFTRGQVNPFGLCIDPWFHFYTADCHSKPITNLIPGATYESFGTTKDALGFGPVMFGYDPGGTGLCGVAWYDADHFPASYKGNLFLGNVVTSRVNMCKVEWTGATPKAVKQSDFITSKDPWFRPVDVKLGPDGAVYVNDFYNKIIGHYEVDLKHPGRDKERGRIWRVVKAGTEPKPAFEDLTKLKPVELVMHFESPNLAVRRAAWEQFVLRTENWSKAIEKSNLDSIGVKNLPRVLSTVVLLAPKAGLLKKDTDYLGFGLLLGAEPENPDSLVLAVAIAKSLGMQDSLSDGMRKMLVSMLAEPSKPTSDPKVKRAVAEAMAIHPHADFVKPLVELLGKVLPGDDHLRHTVRIALRNCAYELKKWDAFKAGEFPIDVAMTVRLTEAADYLALSLELIPPGQLSAAAEHIARHGYASNTAKVLVLANGIQDSAHAYAVLQAFLKGFQGTGAPKMPTKDVTVLLNRIATDLEKGSKEVRLLAIGFAGELKATLPPTFNYPSNTDPLPMMRQLVADDKANEDVRSAALEVALRFDRPSSLATSEKLIDAPETPPMLRERAALLLAASADRNHKQAAKDAIRLVPYRSGVVIATALAGNGVGGEILLEAVKQGKAPARVLQEKLVVERLRAANIPDFDKRLADLTKGLQPADQKLADLLKVRNAKFAGVKADKEVGAKLFTKHCAACHRIGNDGGKVGPNLDGVGLRGLERLLEDTLDPNRNVDAAFRARVLNLADGTTKSGLMLRVEGEALVMADDQGKEYRVPTKDIEKNRETALSPMPANFGEAIPEADFYHLLAYLLDQKAKEPPK